MKTNLIAIVVDQSGSMSHLQNDLRVRTEKLLSDIRARADQDNRVGLFVFGTKVDGPMKDYPATFMDAGSTSLFDAIGKAIESLDKMHVTGGGFPWEQPEAAKLLIVLTDGQENSSKTWNAAMVKNAIHTRQQTGVWTFAFQLPQGNAETFARAHGIPRENLTEWEATKQGFERTMTATTSGLQGFYEARNLGKTSVQTFYKTTTDLSDVDKSDLKKLANLTQRFQQLTVPREMDIQTFVEQQTGQTYIPGTAFYQLTKPEKIQATKQVCLMEKGKKTVLGGPQAREVVGLLPYQDGKVTPGNHANFDIFVQSTSTNRKLVRGTKLLVTT